MILVNITLSVLSHGFKVQKALHIHQEIHTFIYSLFFTLKDLNSLTDFNVSELFASESSPFRTIRDSILIIKKIQITTWILSLLFL